MSLLMDALKKAEEAKLQAQSGASADTSSGARAREERARLPDLPGKLELLDEQFTTHSGRAADPRAPVRMAAPPAQEQERQAAAQVFAAKTPAPRNVFQLTLGLFTAAAMLAMGAYFWWQMQPRASLSAAAPTPYSMTPERVAGARQAPPGTMRSFTRDEAATAASTTGAASFDLPPISAGPAPVRPKALPPKPLDAPTARHTAPATESGQLTDSQPDLPTLNSQSQIHISRAKPQIDPAVANGYRYFQSDDLPAAQREYERALRNDPRNTDALDGLAAISLRQNRDADALGYYQRALEANPMDATAQAGLINLRGRSDPQQAERRLAALTAARPDAHEAHFALGNLYAAHGRWREAQEAYFEAYAAEPADPDYQFNLAVSLDQLHQPKSALQYYRSALAAAATRPAAFDKEQAAARVQELQH